MNAVAALVQDGRRNPQNLAASPSTNRCKTKGDFGIHVGLAPNTWRKRSQTASLSKSAAYWPFLKMEFATLNVTAKVRFLEKS